MLVFQYCFATRIHDQYLKYIVKRLYAVASSLPPSFRFHYTVIYLQIQIIL